MIPSLDQTLQIIIDVYKEYYWLSSYILCKVTLKNVRINNFPRYRNRQY